MKKLLFLFILISILIVTGENSAQRPKAVKGNENENKPKTPKELIDSLKRELKHSKNDTNKVNILNAMSYQYYDISGDSAIIFANKAIELSQLLKWEKGLSNGYYLLGWGNYSKIEYDSAQKYFEIGLKIAQKLEYNEGIGNNLRGIANCFAGKRNYNEAKIKLNEALKFFKKGNYSSSEIKVYSTFCQILHDEGKIDSSIVYYEKILKIYEDNQDENNISLTLNKIGYLYMNYLFNYTKALEYFEKGLKIDEKIGDKRMLGGNLCNIGIIYKKLSNYPKALEYFEKALKVLEEAEATDFIANTLSNIGNIYSDLSNFPKALEYYEKALKILEEGEDMNKMAGILYQIGYSNYSLSDFPKALEYFEKALKIAEEIGDKWSISAFSGNIGQMYSNLSNFPKALESFEKALKIAEEIGDYKMIGGNLCNIGSIYHNLSNYTKALEYYEKALKVLEEIGDKKFLARTIDQIGCIYGELSNNPKALENFEKALKIAEEIGDKEMVSGALGNIGTVYGSLSNYSKAFEFNEKALKIAVEIGNKSLQYLNKENIGYTYLKIAKDSLKPVSDSSKKENLRLALSFTQTALNGFKEIKVEDQQMHCEANLSQIYDAMGNYQSSLSSFKNAQVLKDSIFSLDNKKKIANIEAKKDLEIKEKENELLKQDAVLKESELARRNQEMANLTNRQRIQKLELDKRNLDILSKNNELTLLEKDKEINNIALKQKEAEQDKSKKEIQLLNKDKQYQGVVRKSLFGGVGLLTGLASILFLFFWRKKKDNKKLEEKNIQITEQKEIIEIEQEKSEKLLLNVLPPIIATRLKAGETTIADHYDEASVVFIDIVDFTKSSAGIDPKRVVEVLNVLYTKLDTLAQKHGLEKIKTIGDCYMAAAGVPEIRKDNAEMAAKFAIEAMNTIRNYNTGDGTVINFRCGIDCGPVVAGVIGEKKFIYDLWGDTVNTAARMEEYGEPGRIQVTERFKNTLSHPMTGSHRMTFNERGEIDVKGKGKMKTFFLENNH